MLKVLSFHYGNKLIIDLIWFCVPLPISDVQPAPTAETPIYCVTQPILTAIVSAAGIVLGSRIIHPIHGVAGS